MNNTFIKILLLLLLVFTISPARTHEQRVNDYLQAVEHAKTKVQKFKEAVKSGDPAKIKKATLEIQEDPAAIKELNKENIAIKKKFVDTTDAIQSETIKNIKQKVAEKYGVRPEEVEIKKFTNPSSEVKAGHDWDVTVTVKGEDIPYQKVKKIVHDSYFDAAGGKKAYPNTSATDFAETHHVEVTSKGHAEAYEGGKEYIDNTGTHKVKDPERLSKTIEHKSDLEYKKAKEYEASGEYGKSEVSKHEQARQYTKQYEKHIKPRIKEMGGRIPDNVRKGTNILKKIGKYDKGLKRTYTPADADVDLAKMGETAESIVKKGSALVESGQKLGPRTKEHRLKKKLGHAQEELESAFQKGDKEGMLKAKNKIARTKAELKQVQSESTSKTISSEEPLGGKTVKASGTAATEEGALMKGTKTAGKAAGKVLETVGTGAVIFNTAQDVKESLQGKKSWKETGKNAADLATMGAISTTEHTIEKNSDYKKSIDATSKAQEGEDEAEILARGLSLRKNGVSKSETQKIMDDMRRGDNNSFYKKANELRKKGKSVHMEVPRQVMPEGPDDTSTQRAIETKEGIIEYGKRAGRFVKQAGKDILEIGKGSVETQKNTIKAYYGNKKADAQLEKIKERLIKEGVSPEGAQIAIDRYKDGHKETLDHVIKQLSENKLKKSREQYHRKYTKLIKLGASEVEAAKALAGKPGSVGKLIKNLRDKEKKKKQEKEKAKQEKLSKKAKALIEKAEKEDNKAKAEAARERLKQKTAESKKEELSEKAKALIKQADQADSEAEAARERLKQKIAQSKKEELSDKAKDLIAQADQADEEAKTAGQNTRNSFSHSGKYKEMTPEEQHEALKKDSDSAWEGLKKDLLNGDVEDALKALSRKEKSSQEKDSVLNSKNDAKPQSLSGMIKGSWSGKGKMEGLKGLISSSGGFRMTISKSGKISGHYWGDDKGRLGGHVSPSGKLKMKSGGGMAGSGRWSGRVTIDSNSVLHGSGHWSVDNFSGSWHGTGK